MSYHPSLVEREHDNWDVTDPRNKEDEKMTWTRPQAEVGHESELLDNAPDFWIDSNTSGSGSTFMDGVLLRGVARVSTWVGVDQATEVTVTFFARTLNKGDRP